MKSTEKALPGFEGLFSEIISENKRKRKRGRPRKYNNLTHRTYLKNRSALMTGLLLQKRAAGGEKLTVRQQQNLIRAERAWNILQKSENGASLLQYYLKRSTLLAELGRIESKDWLIRTAEAIAFNSLKGETARIEIRKVRYGNRFPDWMTLCRKIRKAMREYRRLFPYQTDEHFKMDFASAAKFAGEESNWKIASNKTSPDG